MKTKSFIPIILLLCFGALLGLGTSRLLKIGDDNESRNYISWEDMKVIEGGEIDNTNAYYYSWKWMNHKANWTTSNTNTNTNANIMKANRVIVVDKRGRGDSLTVQGAIDMIPHSNTHRVKIFILPAIYREKVIVPRTKPYISFVGKEGNARDTVISWSNRASDPDGNGGKVGTYRTASVSIESDFFCATAITFENTVVAKPGEEGNQAAALRITGDKSMFYKVRILGSQDTLNDETGSHYFYQSYIEGSIDFIFGNAKSLYQECDIRSNAERYGAIAAHHRNSENDDTGYSFVNCDIAGTGELYLGRAWGNYSRIIYSNCNIEDIITPVGWTDWDQPDRQEKVLFGEYNCMGRGAERRQRVPWSKNLTQDQVKFFLNTDFINGKEWLRL